jgi:hypothetical protein
MKPSRTPRLAAAIVFVPLLGGPAVAETPEASLLDALSLISGGLLAPRERTPEVTHDGDLYHVRVPLPALTTPPNAAIEIAANRLGSSIWDITSLTLPPSGAVLSPPGDAKAPPVSLRYTIGQQTAHARVDTTLAVPSAYATALGNLAFQFVPGGSTLTVRQIGFDGTVSGSADGRMTTRSRSKMEQSLLTIAKKDAASATVTIQSADFTYDMVGVDRAKLARLQAAMRPPAAPDQAGPDSPGKFSPATLRSIVEAGDGLMSGYSLDETFHGLHFDSGAGLIADVGTIRFAMAAQFEEDHFGTRVQIGLTDLGTTAAAPYYVPRTITIEPTLSGINAKAMQQFLLHATDANADPATLGQQAVALLNEPGSYAGIQVIAVQGNPLSIAGSARVRPLPDGTAAYDIHLTARGLDAMMRQAQADPSAQQVMPMLFMAKGMARPDGDSLVWDIAFANGSLTVNGTPMGGPRGGQAAGARPGGQPMPGGAMVARPPVRQ